MKEGCRVQQLFPISLSSSPPARLSSMYLSVVRGGGGGGGGRVASLIGHSPLLAGHRPVC